MGRQTDTVFEKQVKKALAGNFDKEYWHSRTPEERLRAMEMMRRITYGYDENFIPRLQRVLKVTRYE